jgi:aminoglycoside phosphotransferase (APT) family kinase protein
MPWAAALARAQPQLTGLAALVTAGARRAAIVCHRDFTPANVLPGRRDGRLIVLDWENAGPLEPEWEIGAALVGWCAGRCGFDPVAARGLLDGYRAVAGGLPALGPGPFRMTVVTHLNFLEAMATQALDDPAHRGYAEQRIASLLDHGLDDLRRNVDLGSKALDLPG